MTNPRLDIDEFARLILFGTTLEEKLAPAPPRRDPPPPAPRPAFTAPAFPGRPPKLLRIGNSKFPSAQHLENPTARGQVLHFFANHELLAMELMALVLLEFPAAPAAFRAGIVHTIQEEQGHMRLYLARMHELGVELGDLPLTDYFWNVLKRMRSPLDFVTQMSLTFEQANLDFSLYYRDAMARHGDPTTAAILERVYRDEIGHVKHGLLWFNRWREHPEDETDWDAYKRLLPPPLSPRRAKGVTFSVEARREVGLSETFIRELEINSGSKGRPPVLWIYNPSCEAEIARGTPGFLPPQRVRRMADDLAPLLMLLARDADMISVPVRPRIEWLKSMADAGFQVPEFVEGRAIREPKLGGMEPWGWSPEVFDYLRPLRERLIGAKGGRAAWDKALLAHAGFASTGLGTFFSKAWSAEFLGAWMRAHPDTLELFGSRVVVGTTATSPDAAHARIDAVLAQGQRVVLKAPWGTAGNQIKRVRTPGDLTGPLRGWIRNTIASQGGLVIEPWLNKLHDLSIQIEVHADSDVRLFGAREFLTDARWQYQGTILGRSFRALSPAVLRFLQRALPVWKQLARDVGRALGAGGYRGPAGIDALIWRAPTGDLHLKAMSELNPRWTMGRVALALEDHVAPRTRAAWIIAHKGAIDAAAVAARYPAQFIETKSGRRVQTGVFFTTDTSTAREVLTALVVGDEALAAEMWPIRVRASDRTAPPRSVANVDPGGP